MRTFLSLLTFIFFNSCNNFDTQISKVQQPGTPAIDTTRSINKNTIAFWPDTTIIPKSTHTNLSVLVLPPYDPIANEGISPGIQKYIERVFTSDTSFRLIKFPYRRLMNDSYQNVFDKKYCSPIMEKIKTDIIIMSKLDQGKRTGNMATDKWNFKIKIYNTRTGKQKISSLTAENLTSFEIENLINSKQQELFSEVKSNR